MNDDTVADNVSQIDDPWGSSVFWLPLEFSCEEIGTAVDLAGIDVEEWFFKFEASDPLLGAIDDSPDTDFDAHIADGSVAAPSVSEVATLGNPRFVEAPGLEDPGVH